jgi:hypothetical protein
LKTAYLHRVRLGIEFDGINSDGELFLHCVSTSSYVDAALHPCCLLIRCKLSSAEALE